MTEKLKNAFKMVGNVNPSSDLEGRILVRIYQEAERQVGRRRLFSWFGFSATLAGIVVAVVLVGNALVQSDFWSLLSLLFTDAGVVLADWRTFGFSLLETFPAVSLTAFLIPIVVLFLSLWLHSSAHKTARHPYAMA